METLSWLPVWEGMPAFYEAVIVCYRYREKGSEDSLCVGEGHRVEPAGWVILSESNENNEFGREVPLHDVLAWMPFPASPDIELRQRPPVLNNKLACDNTPLQFLALNVRIHHALQSNGITTTGKLCMVTERHLLMMRNIGRKSVEDIKRKLQAIGLSLAVEGE